MLKRYNVTTLQCYNITILQCYNITKLQSYNITMLQYYNSIMLQYYNVAILQCYNITILQYLTHYNITPSQWYNIITTLQNYTALPIKMSQNIWQTLPCLYLDYPSVSLAVIPGQKPHRPNQNRWKTTFLGGSSVQGPLKCNFFLWYQTRSHRAKTKSPQKTAWVNQHAGKPIIRWLRIHEAWVTT